MRVINVLGFIHQNGVKHIDGTMMVCYVEFR